jgi:hypothetical protein
MSSFVHEIHKTGHGELNEVVKAVLLPVRRFKPKHSRTSATATAARASEHSAHETNPQRKTVAADFIAGLGALANPARDGRNRLCQQRFGVGLSGVGGRNEYPLNVTAAQ